MPEQREGWGWPGASKKAHYFRDGRALCGGWLFFGPYESGNDSSPDNCAQCKKRRAKELAAPRAATAKGD